ncbi:MAG: T9SS type A sorting domain-containing protein, partial [candidate division WOR-3 bacterium]|nr:T9SS type A sorting domain-containing protein [candidate division WOR-3 bacterium]
FRHPDSVHNGNMTGIALTNGCNALFMMGADTSNIGRGFLTCQTGGAVAYQGCSRPSSFEMVGPKLPYYDFLREVYEWNVTRLGLAHVAAITTARGTGRDRAYWNILGDPLMDIWTDIPKGFAVTHPPYIPPQAVSFTVTVLDTLAQLPVDGALVCLCMHDSATGEYPLYHIGKTAPDGTATFFIAPRVTGEILVTVTKHNYLPHTSTCHIGLHSDDPNATYPNWGRKFVREPNTDNFHVAFTSGDTTFYSRSTDGGASWSAAEPIGAGTSPAIALNAAIGGGEPVPWVAYLTSGGSIMRAIRDVPGSPGIWNKAVVFQGGPGASAGAPSLAVPAISSSQFPEAFVTYPVCLGTQPTNHFVYFNTFTPYSVSPPETVDAAGPTTCYGASVAVSPLSIVHVGWIRGQSVIYRQRLNSVWSAQVPISSPSLWPVTEPASNPSMEAYGDSVFCVWRGPNDNGVFPGDIWRRSRSLNWLPQLWADAANQSKTPDRESDFPVMTTSFATVWQEKVALDNYPDIWGKFLAEPYARPFFESPLPSTYPHADGYWVPGTATFKCHFAWTEMLDQFLPLYEVKFGSRDYTTTLRKGFGPEPHYSYEPSLYYAAELGQAKQSPYCVSRGGYTKFEGWNVDTSATTLRYQLPYMDPRQVYKLCAVIYHAGKRSWSANVRCDSGQWTSVKTEPGVPDTVWLKVPKRLYRQDARIVLELARATGDYVSLAELKLYQVEDRSRDEEGTQSAGTSSAFVTRLRSCTPNPFAKSTSVNYELGHAGPVALTVHDVSGRLVRRLESGPRPVGRHVVRWNGTDARGRVVPAGVYFVRLSADGQVSTGRLTLVR